ncbi:hypothetical protein [Persephonella sp.]
MLREKLIKFLTVALIATNEVALIEVKDEKLDEIRGGYLNNAINFNLNSNTNSKIILWDEKKILVPKIKNNK